MNTRILICLLVLFCFSKPLFARAEVDNIILDFKRDINIMYPAEKQTEEFKNSVNDLYNEYQAYLELYFKATDVLPDVVGPDAIDLIDEGLKEEVGVTVYELNEKARKLTEKIDLEIIPKLYTYYVNIEEPIEPIDPVNPVSDSGLKDFAESKDKYKINYVFGASGRKYSKISDIVTYQNALDLLGANNPIEAKKNYKNIFSKGYHPNSHLLLNLDEASKKNARSIWSLANAAYRITEETRTNRSWSDFEVRTPEEHNTEHQRIVLEELNKLSKQFDKRINLYKTEVSNLSSLLNTYSSKSKSYIATPVEERPDLEMKGNIFKRLRRSYLIDEIISNALLEKYRLEIEANRVYLEEAKDKLLVRTKTEDALKNKKLNELGLIEAERMIEETNKFLNSKAQNVSIAQRVPTFLTTNFFGRGIHLYLIMAAKDMFNVVTFGVTTHKTVKHHYVNMAKGLIGCGLLSISPLFEYGVVDDTGFLADFYGDKSLKRAWKSFEEIFGHYLNPESAIALMSFMGVSHTLSSKLSTSSVMGHIFRFSDKHLYAVGGRNLTGGILNLGVCMGLGMEVSRVVGVGLSLRSEILSSNGEISSLAWQIIGHNSISAPALQHLGQVLLSFGIADVVLSEKVAPRFYDSTMRVLNRKKCKYTTEDIARLLAEKEAGQRSFWGMSKKYFKVFVVAEMAENLLISKFIFPNARDELHQGNIELYSELYKVQKNVFIEALLDIESPSEADIEKILDMNNSSTTLRDIIKNSRNDKSGYLLCLKLRETGSNDNAKKCLENLFETGSSLDPIFIKEYNKLGRSTGNTIKLSNELLSDISARYNSEEERERREEQSASLVDNLIINKDVNLTVEDRDKVESNIEQAMLNLQIKELMQLNMIEKAKEGKVAEAIEFAGKAFDPYKMHNVKRLFSDIIKDSWKVDFVSANRAEVYLEKMIDLFKVQYPKMINSDAFIKDKLANPFMELRIDLLSAIAKGLFREFKRCASLEEFEQGKERLLKVKQDIDKNSKDNSSYYVALTYLELGLTNSL